MQLNTTIAARLPALVLATGALAIGPAAAQAAVLSVRGTPSPVTHVVSAIPLQSGGSTGDPGSASDGACDAMVGVVNQLRAQAQLDDQQAMSGIPGADLSQGMALRGAADNIENQASDSGCILID